MKAFMRFIESVLQSNEEFNLDNGLEIEFTRFDPRNVGTIGHNQVYRGNFKKWLNKKACFVHIKNNDNLCFPRTVMVAIAHFHRKDSRAAMSKYVSIRRYNKPQKHAVEKLLEDAGLQYFSGSCKHEHVQKIQDALPDYQLKVFSLEKCFTLDFVGREKKEKVLHIFTFNDHAAVITSMTAFFVGIRLGLFREI